MNYHIKRFEESDEARKFSRGLFEVLHLGGLTLHAS
jgi:hypothetical protein